MTTGPVPLVVPAVLVAALVPVALFPGASRSEPAGSPLAPPTPIAAPATGVPAASARPAPASPYRPPTTARVAHGFDAPGPYAAGNRGLDYATVAGEPVAAIGDGAVVFAGAVAGAVWVTVLHPDGLRSSLGPLASLDVSVGDRVRRGRRLGTSAGPLHLGVRRGDRYLDPAALFSPHHAHLVPVAGTSPGG